MDEIVGLTDKCLLCNQKLPPKTGTEAMMRIAEEERVAHNKMIWDNLSKEIQERYLKEFEERRLAGIEALKNYTTELMSKNKITPLLTEEMGVGEIKQYVKDHVDK